MIVNDYDNSISGSRTMKYAKGQIVIGQDDMNQPAGFTI